MKGPTRILKPRTGSKVRLVLFLRIGTGGDFGLGAGLAGFGIYFGQEIHHLLMQLMGLLWHCHRQVVFFAHVLSKVE
jgi:hypothetical protein